MGFLYADADELDTRGLGRRIVIEQETGAVLIYPDDGGPPGRLIGGGAGQIRLESPLDVDGYQSSITLEPSGVTISGQQVNLPGGEVYSNHATMFVSTSFQPYRNLPGAAGFGNVEAYRDPGGVVHLEGLIAATATVTAGTAVACRLPAEYASRKTLIRDVMVSGNVIGRVDVGADGRLVYSAGPTLAAGQFISLNLSWLGVVL